MHPVRPPPQNSTQIYAYAHGTRETLPLQLDRIWRLKVCFCSPSPTFVTVIFFVGSTYTPTHMQTAIAPRPRLLAFADEENGCSGASATRWDNYDRQARREEPYYDLVHARVCGAVRRSPLISNRPRFTCRLAPRKMFGSLNPLKTKTSLLN